MKIWRGSPGYTMAELLVALATALLCSLLLTMLARWAAQWINASDFLVQDQMAILQLRLYLAQCEQLQVEQGTLKVTHQQADYTFQLHQQRLVKRPGYEIFLADVDAANFVWEGDAYYLEWQRDAKRWRAKISE